MKKGIYERGDSPTTSIVWGKCLARLIGPQTLLTLFPSLCLLQNLVSFIFVLFFIFSAAIAGYNNFPRVPGPGEVGTLLNSPFNSVFPPTWTNMEA